LPVLLVLLTVVGVHCSFDRIIIFMFENHGFLEVSRDPMFTKFAKLGRLFMNYYAITHPSQPNYWCQIAGDYFGIRSDGNRDLSQSNLVDLLEKQGVTWKAYQEDYPGNCSSTGRSGKYYRKHNPFISFNNIRNNRTRCAKIVNAKQLDVDLSQGTLPQYMYYTPNIDNDCHDTDIAFGGKWLNGFLTSRLSKFPKGTLIFVTWDEDEGSEDNRIFTFMLGSMITPGSQDANEYNHYSLLRTVEANWGLGNLGRNDADATPIKF